MNAASRPKIFVLTESDGFFGQRAMPWESMDVDRIIDVLSQQFDVTRTTYAEVASEPAPKNATFIHSSSQQPEYKRYIDDVLLYLHEGGNRLVPSIHATRSHDNKGYQELHKRLRGIPSPTGIYSAKIEEVPRTLSYPLVFKEVSGFGSSGVSLVQSHDELTRAAAGEQRLTLGEAGLALRRLAGGMFRRHVLRRPPEAFGDYYRPRKRFVLQQYLPALTHDFKVLAFGDRMFALRREVRTGDFRASGSGRLSFVDPPPALLDFAYDLLLRFDEPYMSFDICEFASTYQLIEFQGVHFGPYALTASNRHFRRTNSGWQERPGKSELEQVVAESLVDYLQKFVLAAS